MFSTICLLAMPLRKTPHCRLAILALCTLLAFACSGKPKDRIAPPVVEPQPSETVRPIPTSTPEAEPSEPSATPIARTPIATPTATPTATPIASTPIATPTATPIGTPISTPATSPTPTPTPLATAEPIPMPSPTPSMEPNNPSDTNDVVIQAQLFTNSFDLTESASFSVSLEPTLDPRGGEFNVGYIEDGEWLDYTFAVPYTANYLFDARIASLNGGGQFRVLVDGVERGEVLQVDATGGWQSWSNVSTDLGELTAGVQTLRIQVISGGFNLNWFSLIEAEGEIHGRAWLPNFLASSSAIVQPVLTGLEYSEGPVADSYGNVYFSEFGGEHKIWQVNTITGVNSVYRNPSNFSNGLAIDISGRLLAAERGQIAVESSPGDWQRVTASPNADANDLSPGINGDLFFTDFSAGSFFYLDAANNRSEYSGFNQPNGIEWDTQNNFVYIALTGDNRVIRYDVDPLTATLSNQHDFAAVNSPDGLTLDENGNLYVASFTDAAIYVFNLYGFLLGEIEVDAANVSNCAFGGIDGSTLYITGDGGLREIKLNVAGFSSTTP